MLDRLDIPPGTRFGQWTVLFMKSYRCRYNGIKFAKYQCVCDCGRAKIIGVGSLHSYITVKCRVCGNNLFEARRKAREKILRKQRRLHAPIRSALRHFRLLAQCPLDKRRE